MGANGDSGMTPSDHANKYYRSAVAKYLVGIPGWVAQILAPK